MVQVFAKSALLPMQQSTDLILNWTNMSELQPGQCVVRT
jgi:hypothetical protein